MSYKIFQIITKKFIVKLVLSKCWFSFVPWASEGANLFYFDRTFEDHDDVHIRIIYAGPFAMIIGNWVG